MITNFQIFRILNIVQSATVELIAKYGSYSKIPDEIKKTIIELYPLYPEYKAHFNREKRLLSIHSSMREGKSINGIHYKVITEWYGNTRRIALKTISDEKGNEGFLKEDGEKVIAKYRNLIVCEYRNRNTGFSEDAVNDLMKTMYLCQYGEQYRDIKEKALAKLKLGKGKMLMKS